MTCLDRIEQAERLMPKRQAAIVFVSTYVRQQVYQLYLRQPEVYAMYVYLMPAYYLERVVATRPIR